jgi:gluconolactonase
MTVLVDSYQEKRFNSRNDLVYAGYGSLFFTDPPYGHASQQDNDPKKELSFNSIFMIPMLLKRRRAQRHRNGLAYPAT